MISTRSRPRALARCAGDRCTGRSAIRRRRTPPTSSSHSTRHCASVPQRALVVASAEGRLDHLLASLLLLGADRYASLELDAIVGDSSVHVVRARRVLTGTPGDAREPPRARRSRQRSSHAKASPTRSSDETLEAGSSRGVSNVFAAERSRDHRRPRRAARRPPRGSGGVTTLATVCCKRWLAFAVVLAAMLAAGCGGGEDEAAPTEVVLLTHDSFAISKDVRQRVRARERPAAPDPPGGRRERDAEPRAAHRRRPAGRRHLRDRRQRALASDRRRPARGVPARRAGVGRRHVRGAVRPGDADRPRRGVPQRRPRLGSPSAGSRRPSRLEDLTEPRYRNLLVVENPATSSPGLAFLLATVARFGEDGWSVLLARASGERRARGRRLGGGVHAAVLGRGGKPWQAPDRRLVRDEPGRGGDLRHEAAGGRSDGGRRGRLLPTGRVRRDPARCPERGRRPQR